MQLRTDRAAFARVAALVLTALGAGAGARTTQQPGGAPYGSDAVQGVIDIITRGAREPLP